MGIAMAIGVGVAVASNREAVPVSAATVAGSFNTFSGSISEGDYIITYGNYALKNVISSNRFANASKGTDYTVSNGTITNPDGSIVWHIAANGNYWTIYNASVSKYAGGKTTKNNGALLDSVTDYAKWTVTGSLTYDFENLGRATGSSDTGNKWLRNNEGYGWAPYASSTGGALTLYKKVEASTDKIDDSTNPFTVSSTPTVSRGASLPSISGWTVIAKLVGKDTPVSITSGLTIVGTPSTATVGNVSVTLRYTASSGGIPLNSGNATYDFTTSMTVNPQQASVEFKQDSYTIAPSGTLTLTDEITQSGDGDLTFSITSGSNYVSIDSNNVLTAIAEGTATIQVVKQYSTYTSYSDTDTATIEVSNVATWSHTFATSGTADFTADDQTKTLSNASWTLDTNGGYFGVNSDYGQQIGSGSNPATSITLTTSAFEGYAEIKTVKVTTGGAKDVSAVVTVQVGETAYQCGGNDSASYTLNTGGTDLYVFQSESPDCGDIVISWSQSTSKAIYIEKIEVIYDNSEIEQGGIKAQWADSKGSYYNGSITATTTFSSAHIVIYKTTSTGKTYDDANDTGVGFKIYLKNSAGKWVKTDKTTSDTEVVFLDASLAVVTQAMTGFDAGTYSLYVTTAKDGGGVWTSSEINFSVLAKAPQTITRASEPSKTEFIAYVDTFAAFTGKINVQYNDGATDNNRTPTIKYYNGETEVDISTYLNANKFAVNSNTKLTVRLYDTGYVGGDYVYNSYSIYIYAGTFSCVDGNGDDAEYESGGTVALNPAPKISYTDKDSNAQVLNLTSSDVDLYIKIKGVSGDGEAYSGTMPEVETPTDYTITAVYIGNSAYKDSYDIEVVNATFSIDTTDATKSYIYGTNFSKTGLVVQLQYGSGTPTTLNPTDYTVEDENGNVLDVIKFIGSQTVTVRYKGYSATYEITSSNVGSSETYVHDDVPGEWEAGSASYVAYQSATNTCTEKGSLLAVDGFDYGTVASNNTYPALLNGSSIIGKNNAFDSNYVKSITFSMNIKVDNSGPKFSITLAAVSGTTISTTYVATSSEVTAGTSDKSLSVTINDIPYDANITGWYMTVSKSGTGNNAQFNSMRVDYTPYVRGEDQTFNSTPFEQALSYAVFFLEVTDNYCTVSLTSETKTLLHNEYNGMVSDAKTVFTEADIVRGKGATYENDISEALSRYANMVEEKGTGDFLSLGSSVLQKGTSNHQLTIFGNTNNMIPVIVVISMISVTAVGGYFFLRKRKED